MFRKRWLTVLLLVTLLAGFLVGVPSAVAENPDETTFLELTDTPSSYSGQDGRVVYVESSSPDELLFSDAVYIDSSDVLHVDGNWIVNYYGLSSIANLYMLLDSDNNSTTERFMVKKDSTSGSGGTDLFKVEESGEVSILAGSLNVGDTILPGDLDLDGGASNTLIGGEATADGGYLIWSDADWDGTLIELWDTAESDGPVHGLWVRSMAQHQERGDVQVREAVLTPGNYIHIYFFSDEYNRDSVRLDWDDTFPDGIQLWDFVGGGYNDYRVTLLMMWLGD